MRPVRLLSRSDLERALDFDSVLRVLESAFATEERGGWDTPTRIAARTSKGGLLAMPCAGGEPEALGAKLVSTFPGNSALGLPGVAGLYALFDSGNGIPLAVMDGGYLTLIRTAGVSALAAHALSRANATTLGVLGAGAQAEFHIRILSSVRPIETVVIWSRRREQASALASRMRSHGSSRVLNWVVAERVEEPARCDLVVTATAATTPVLAGSMLSENAHLTAIGAHTPDTREVDTEAVRRAATLVVETSDTLREAGDLRIAEREAGGILSRVRTLGSVLAASRRPETAVSLFKSCGVAFEDLAVAKLAFERSETMNLGSAFQLA